MPSACLPRASCRESGNGNTTLPRRGNTITKFQCSFWFEDLVEPFAEIHQHGRHDGFAVVEYSPARDPLSRERQHRDVPTILMDQPALANAISREPRDTFLGLANARIRRQHFH